MASNTQTMKNAREARELVNNTKVQSKFANARAALQASLIERDDEIDVVLTALIAREHPLLVGPPGTAKSMLLDSLLSWTGSSQSFTVLFNKFTTPEEVFGPISVNGLKQDVYRRVTAGKLPEADFAFADEIFKASSAILNTMLRILNERVYDNGTGQLDPVPLQICIAASNEWPSDEGGKELGALFDRFLFRKTVKPIRSAAGLNKLLWSQSLAPKFTDAISTSEIEHAQQTAAALDFTSESQEAFVEIVRACRAEGIAPGDRRLRKSVGACRAFAYLNGAKQVDREHLEILAHTLWDDPAEQPTKVAAIVNKIANPLSMRINGILEQADDVIDKNPPVQASIKLKELLKQLGAFADDSAGKVERAQDYVKALLQETYRKAVGE